MTEEESAGGVWLTIGIIVLVIGGFLVWQYLQGKSPIPISSVSYTCNEGKIIQANFYAGKVSLNLSDGRKFTLPQVMAASGIRYANQDESFVFWSKGNTAFVSEGPDQTQTYINCITTSTQGGEENWNTYASSTAAFSIGYPSDYTVDEQYVYDQLGPGRYIPGVRFVIPTSMATGTNLSDYDTGVSVETLPKATNCSASFFLYDSPKAVSYTDNGVTYSVASTSGAGAGNFYEEEVWAIPGTKPCIAVRYFIHSTNIGNYPPDTVTEFDRQALLEQFDKIRQSLVLGN